MQDQILTFPHHFYRSDAGQQQQQQQQLQQQQQRSSSSRRPRPLTTYGEVAAAAGAPNTLAHHEISPDNSVKSAHAEKEVLRKYLRKAGHLSPEVQQLAIITE